MPIPMKALLKYVDTQNHMTTIFGGHLLDLNSMKDVMILRDSVEGDLSPENLTCDGELRGQALNTKARFLNQVKADLDTLIAQRA